MFLEKTTTKIFKVLKKITLIIIKVLKKTTKKFKYVKKVKINTIESVTINTIDSDTFVVDWDVARQSKTIRTMLDDLNIKEDAKSEVTLFLYNKEVIGSDFKKALVWMEKNRSKSDLKWVNVKNKLKRKEYVNWSQLNQWEKDYINIPVDEMFPLLITANFLEIKGLVDLMVKAIALQIQGKTVEEIQKTFGIQDPKWTPEELQKLKERNAWAYKTKK